MERVIPSFYCCYLLRSRRSRSDHYIGSTPSMPRRLRQHNGSIRGGAKRTAWKTRKPWEVVCVVHGFPSNIAALQFEWAWGHPDTTRHIGKEERLTVVKTVERVSRRTGRVYRKRVKPRKLGFGDVLGNLLRLLCSSTFCGWPLSLRFFSDELHQLWRKTRGEQPGSLRDDFDDRLDVVEWPKIPKYLTQKKAEQQTAEEKKRDDELLKEAESFVPLAIRSLDAKYHDVKEHLTKSLSLDGQMTGICSICSERLAPQENAVIVCPKESCRVRTHIACMADHILAALPPSDSIRVPTHGHCPECKTELDWTQLMKETSLRIRGQKEVAQLMKPPRKRKGIEVFEDSDSELSELDGDPEDLLSNSDEDSDDDILDEILEAEPEIEPAKPKRGRPKKSVPLPEAAEAKAETVKPKRGRPKKSDTPNQKVGTAEKTPAKRKTPAKKATPAVKSPAAKKRATPRSTKKSTVDQENRPPAIANSDGWSEAEVLD